MPSPEAGAALGAGTAASVAGKASFSGSRAADLAVLFRRGFIFDCAFVLTSIAGFVSTFRATATTPAFCTGFFMGRRVFFAGGLRAAKAFFRPATDFLEAILRRLKFAAFLAAAKAAACISSASLRAFLDALRASLKSRRACFSRRFATRARSLASLACAAAALARAVSARAAAEAVRAGSMEMGSFINSHWDNR